VNRGVHTYGRILCVPVPVFCNKQIFSPLVCHTSELVKYGSSSLALHSIVEEDRARADQQWGTH